MDTKITIIRTFWGNTKRALNEIFPMPIFPNEVVYVWGLENQQMLQQRGFNTVLMGKECTEAEYSTIHLQYYHKLQAIQRAETEHSEFIFLDWDCYMLKPLDNYFYKTL